MVQQFMYVERINLKCDNLLVKYIYGVAAINFLIYHLHMNIDVFFDLSHGIHNDAANAVYGAKLKAHILMVLLRLNVVVGPWNEDVRWKQLMGSMHEMLTLAEPRRMPLFMSNVHDMLSDSSISHLSSEEDPISAVWNYQKTSNPFVNKGYGGMEPPEN